MGEPGQIVHAVAVSLALVTHFFFGLGLIGPLLGLRPQDTFNGGWEAITMTLAQGVWGLGLVVGVGLMAVARVGPRDLGWRFDRMPRDVPRGVLGAMLLVALVIAPVIVSGKASIKEVLASMGSFTAGQRVEILLVGTLAALIEETVFRGYLMPGLVARVGFPAGLVLSAIIFGAYHAPLGLPVAALALKVVSGVVLGLVRGRDGSIIPSALAHFLFWQIMGFT
jgi:membrane protease YdiL (CAAX protease family)